MGGRAPNRSGNASSKRRGRPFLVHAAGCETGSQVQSHEQRCEVVVDVERSAEARGAASPKRICQRNNFEGSVLLSINQCVVSTKKSQVLQCTPRSSTRSVCSCTKSIRNSEICSLLPGKQAQALLRLLNETRSKEAAVARYYAHSMRIRRRTIFRRLGTLFS